MDEGGPITSPEALGALIRHVRREQGMGQIMLSDLTGVSQGSISQIESGKVQATFDTYLRLMAELGIDLYAVPRA